MGGDRPDLYWAPAPTSVPPSLLALAGHPDWQTLGRLAFAGVCSSYPVEGRWVFISALTRSLSVVSEKIRRPVVKQAFAHISSGAGPWNGWRPQP